MFVVDRHEDTNFSNLEHLRTFKSGGLLLDFVIVKYQIFILLHFFGLSLSLVCMLNFLLGHEINQIYIELE